MTSPTTALDALPAQTPRTIDEHLFDRHPNQMMIGDRPLDRQLAHDRAHHEHEQDHLHEPRQVGPTSRPDQHACCGGISQHARWCRTVIR